jgi:hypothetical protein
MKRVGFVPCLLAIAASFLFSRQSDFPGLKGPYLGQKPPGNTPEVFAPDLISLGSHSECCRAITSDGKEIFFVREIEGGNKIFRTTEGENGWTRPEIINYTDQAFTFTPFISPSGEQLIFLAGKSRPAGGGADSSLEIWMLTRKGKDWVDPHIIDTSIGGARPFYISMARNGTLYFSCLDRPGVYRSEFKEGKYFPVEKLPGEINDLERASHPYIAPDESFIMIHAVDEATESMNLYISFRKSDGTWTKAAGLGDKINSADYEVCPSVSNDGKFIFFGRFAPGEKADIYWVSAKIIEELRPKD